MPRREAALGRGARSLGLWPAEAGAWGPRGGKEVSTEARLLRAPPNSLGSPAGSRLFCWGSDELSSNNITTVTTAGSGAPDLGHTALEVRPVCHPLSHPTVPLTSSAHVHGSLDLSRLRRERAAGTPTLSTPTPRPASWDTQSL